MKTVALALLAACFLHAPFAVQAQAELPTDEQLSAWDAKFMPGLYKVEEFDLDAKGNRVAKSTKTREQCLSSAEMQMISRAPLFAMVLWQCHPKPFEVNFDDGFYMAFACPGVNKNKPVSAISFVSVTADQKSVVSAQLKIEIDTLNGDKKKTVYSKGSELTHLASCVPNAPQAKP
jgi:hypothetical protein